MTLIADVGIKQMNKHGEELCGDTVEVIHEEDGLVLVLSDGMGSGVKANILSTLTAKIASKMISEKVAIEDVVDTLAGTLPVCSERKLAYSTFSIIRFFNNGWVNLVDFDGCDVIRIYRNNEIKPIERTQYVASGRIINEANFHMLENETLVVVSDGVMHAGLGKLLQNGLGTEGLVDTLKNYVDVTAPVDDMAEKIIDICNSFYIQEPDDDTTAVVFRLVKERRVVIMTGPPSKKEMDSDFVTTFLKLPGKKVVCGGTTAQIYARRTGSQLHISSKMSRSGLPPMAYIEGVELVTEGAITMSAAQQILSGERAYTDGDPASKLAELLESAHHVTILQGMRINPAYKGDRMTGLNLRDVVVEKLVKTLQDAGKKVEIKQY